MRYEKDSCRLNPAGGCSGAVQPVGHLQFGAGQCWSQPLQWRRTWPRSHHPRLSFGFWLSLLLSCKTPQTFLSLFDACGETEALAHGDAPFEHSAGLVGLAEQRRNIAQVAKRHRASFIALRGPLLSLDLCRVDVSVRRPSPGCLQIRFARVCGGHRLGRRQVLDQGRCSNRLKRRLGRMLSKR